jgi:DNA-directed RNA polymerase specialized sigma24 family protein
MIALQERTPRQSKAHLHDGFLELLPKIKSLAWRALRCRPMHEREDAMAEVVAIAYMMYRRLVETGKSETAYATPLARFAILRYFDGRHVNGNVSARDAYSSEAQAGGERYLQRLFEFDYTEDRWREAVIDNHQTPVPDQVQFRMDFPVWLETLTRRDRKVAETLVEGESVGAVARMFGISSSRVSQLRSEFRDGWESFLGQDEEEVAEVAGV